MICKALLEHVQQYSTHKKNGIYLFEAVADDIMDLQSDKVLFRQSIAVRANQQS
jgi:hypothetical protein